MNPNPISLAIVGVLAGTGVFAIAFGRLVVPGAVLIALAAGYLRCSRWRNSGSGESSCAPGNPSRSGGAKTRQDQIIASI
jgi:hypothetical protein